MKSYLNNIERVITLSIIGYCNRETICAVSLYWLTVHQVSTSFNENKVQENLIKTEGVMLMTRS